MNTLLQQNLIRQAERRPEAWAVVMGEDRISYGQLEQSTNQLARQLKAVGCQKRNRVCLMMPKSPTAIASILGTLKADCIYVPLDPSSPPSRLKQMIRTCEPSCVLASGSGMSSLDTLLSKDDGCRSVSVGWMGSEKVAANHFTPKFSWSDADSFSSQPVDYQNTEDDSAYILFTSGSTGAPKGVVITHANVMQFVQWAIDYFGINPEDRISGHPPLHFDLSVFDIFGALAGGAELHLVSPELNLLPHKLAAFIRDVPLTQWFSVPSILNYVAKFDAVQFNDFPALRRVLWCGEVFPTPALIYWMKRLPHARFTNLYGPTEATIASSYFTVACCPEDEKTTIPIGRPCPGEELLVLDKTLAPVPAGEVGDLYIRGVGLSPGFWQDPERTAAAFLTRGNNTNGSGRIYKTGDLAKIGNDGLVYFLGRADFQIKSRGYRIELGEIEAALNSFEVLKECAVVAINTNGFEGTTICAAYVPQPEAEIALGSLRRELGKLLPNYMMPAKWMGLDKLPQNANGKIDRRALRERFQEDGAQWSGLAGAD
jgi:amino acid adenylation domain-containing protein